MSSRQHEQIGQRIAAARSARRMSQSELANTAHVSLSTLRKAEQGSRPVTDRVLHALSEALEIDPERLTGKRAHTGSRVHRAIPAIRVAIDAYDLPGEGATPPLPELRAAVAMATRQRLSSQYTRLAESVPVLLSGLTRAVHCPSAVEPREAAALLAHAYRAADAVAFKYGYHDLSGRIIELMRWAAQLADDPLLIATAAYVRTEIFFASGNLDAGLRALDAALDGISTSESLLAQAVVGALHMRAAVVAARLADSAAVDHHLKQARRLCERVPEGIYHGTAFGVASLRVHEISVAVELGDGPRAVETAGCWIPPESLPPERRSHYFIDLARAQLWIGQRDEAFRCLQTARRIAPQQTREHPYVREALITLLRLHLTPSEALISYSEWARAV